MIEHELLHPVEVEEVVVAQHTLLHDVLECGQVGPALLRLPRVELGEGSDDEGEPGEHRIARSEGQKTFTAAEKNFRREAADQPSRGLHALGLSRVNCGK